MSQSASHVLGRIRGGAVKELPLPVNLGCQEHPCSKDLLVPLRPGGNFFICRIPEGALLDKSPISVANFYGMRISPDRKLGIASDYKRAHKRYSKPRPRLTLDFETLGLCFVPAYPQGILLRDLSLESMVDAAGGDVERIYLIATPSDEREPLPLTIFVKDGRKCIPRAMFAHDVV